MKLSLTLSAAIVACCLLARADDKASIQDVLATKMTFEAEDSLEQVLIGLAAKVNADHPEFRIKLIGDDLKLEGITRNQRIRGLKLKDKTVADVLTAIVLKGDPNSRGKGPGDPGLKLVWVVAADPSEPKRQIVLVTTRAGAKKRGEKLPPGFEAKDQAERR